MSDTTTTTPSTRRVARTRGAASGVLLILLGAWAGLAPFIGPLFNFGFSPDKAWHWTAARGWYEVLPGGVIVLGGLLLLFGTSRVLTLTGAWLAILAGGWLVIGPAISAEATLGSLGTPLGHNGGIRAFERMAFFYLLGAVVIFLASTAFGRLSVVTLRDVRVAERREAALAEANQAEQGAYGRRTAERDGDYRDRDTRDGDYRDGEVRDGDRDGLRRDGEVPAAAGGGAYAGNQAVTERPAGQARPYDSGHQTQQYAQDEGVGQHEQTSQRNPYPNNEYDQNAQGRPGPAGYNQQQAPGQPYEGQPYEGQPYEGQPNEQGGYQQRGYDQQQGQQAPPPSR